VTRKSITAALITATLAVVLTACSQDESPSTTHSVPSTAAAASPFGSEASSALIAKIHRDNATAIVETVEARSGSPDQALAALLAAEAETGWRSGLSMAPPSVDIRDIYGWRFGYNIAADSMDAVKAATNTFMDNAATITVSADDPAVYALAIQTADPRGYNEKEHFYKKGETAVTEYAVALPKAQSAYAELRDSQ
jgi:hypothetical protein